jgi:serine/threonine-protein kinase
VADGGVYFVGAQSVAYALDAATGTERWTTSLAGVGEAGNGHNSSFAFADGKLFVMAGRLVALDAASGRMVWECEEATGFSSSPVIWRHEGKTYVIGGEGRHRLAVDAESGAVLWKVPAGGPATPAIHGDLMAVAQGDGLTAYRLSLKGAEKIAETEKGGSKGGSPVAFGSRIYSGSFEAACLDVETGGLVWAGPRGLDHYSSGVLANGILWCPGRGGLLALDPDTGAEIGLLKVDYLRCSSPAVAGGKMFIRTRKAVACYDLAAGAE